jgi:hypothetical protein
VDESIEGSVVMDVLDVLLDVDSGVNRLAIFGRLLMLDIGSCSGFGVSFAVRD